MATKSPIYQFNSDGTVISIPPGISHIEVNISVTNEVEDKDLIGLINSAVAREKSERLEQELRSLEAEQEERWRAKVNREYQERIAQEVVPLHLPIGTWTDNGAIIYRIVRVPKNEIRILTNALDNTGDTSGFKVILVKRPDGPFELLKNDFGPTMVLSIDPTKVKIV